MWAYDRCGRAHDRNRAHRRGRGRAVSRFSAFTPIREFGVLMIAMLAAALVGNLLMLPAILASPLGWFFAPAAVRRLDPLWPKVQELFARRRARRPAAVARPRHRPAPSAASAARAALRGRAGARAARAPLQPVADERREMADGPHAALHAKLQELRRPRTGDSPAT